MSTSLFTQLTGQQGIANGAANGCVSGCAAGTYGYAQQMSAYGMKWIVEQTQVPLVVDTDAEGTPRGQAASSVVVILDTDATGTPRGRAASSVPLKVAASSTARGRVTAAVQAVIRWGVASAARPRVIAQALVRLIRVSATVFPRVIAQTSVPFPIKWVASSFAKQPPRVVRILQNLSRTVVGPADDASRTKIGPVADRTTPTVRVRDDSEA